MQGVTFSPFDHEPQHTHTHTHEKKRHAEHFTFSPLRQLSTGNLHHHPPHNPSIHLLPSFSPFFSFFLFLQDIANLLLFRKLAPMKYSTNMPITPKQLNPANRLTPLLTPRLMNSGRANMILPQARAERKKSLPAKREAAYCG